MADAKVQTPVRLQGTRATSYLLETYVDQGDGTHARGITIVGLDTPVELTGDVMVDTLGDLDDAKELDPDAASATLPALTRGVLANTATLASTVSNYAKQYSMHVAPCWGGTIIHAAEEDTQQDVRTAVQTIAGAVSSIAKNPSLQVGVFYGGGIINPAREGTLQDLLTAVGNASDSAGDPTVIGLLKEAVATLATIATNTTPDP